MIRGMLYKLHKWVWDYGKDDEAVPQDAYGKGGNGIRPSTLRVSNEVNVEGLRFSVMPARGGTVVQVNKYDRRKDQTDTTTYVIPEGEDIAQEVGRIVSMELLTQ
jgi:D-alanine-D-alanine ligase-like ATP-grasp enzyme